MAAAAFAVDLRRGMDSQAYQHVLSTWPPGNADGDNIILPLSIKWYLLTISGLNIETWVANLVTVHLLLIVSVPEARLEKQGNSVTNTGDDRRNLKQRLLDIIHRIGVLLTGS